MQSAMQPHLGTQHQVMQAVRSVSWFPMIVVLLECHVRVHAVIFRNCKKPNCWEKQCRPHADHFAQAGQRMCCYEGGHSVCASSVCRSLCGAAKASE